LRSLSSSLAAGTPASIVVVIASFPRNFA
jgi:hypothetical protein